MVVDVVVVARLAERGGPPPPTAARSAPGPGCGETEEAGVLFVDGRQGEEADPVPVTVGVGEAVAEEEEGVMEVPSAVALVTEAGDGDGFGGRRPGISEENMMRRAAIGWGVCVESQAQDTD